MSALVSDVLGGHLLIVFPLWEWSHQWHLQQQEGYFILSLIYGAEQEYL